MPVELMIFDLAGTLIRDDGLTLSVYRDLAAGEGLEAPDDWFRARMGMQKPLVLADLLTLNGRDAAHATALVPLFEQGMADAFTRTPPEKLPGAQAMLDALDAAGVTVGFNTGFSRATATIITESAGWADVDLVTSDQVDHGRPAPDMIHESMRRAGVTDPATVGVCGDTPSDLLSGAAAGCGLIIGVGHGTHSLDQLRPHPHTHLFDDLSPIPDLCR